MIREGVGVGVGVGISFLGGGGLYKRERPHLGEYLTGGFWVAGEGEQLFRSVPHFDCNTPQPGHSGKLYKPPKADMLPPNSRARISKADRTLTQSATLQIY